MDYLDVLESESIYILRETAAQFQKPVLLFSGGKDSTIIVRLAQKAFYPAKLPFKILHVDTGHNFKETIQFRDQLMERLEEKVIVRFVEDSIKQGKVTDPQGPGASRNALQSVTLLDAIAEFQFDAVIGGARRDEEKARAKERVFSFRNEFGEWDPKAQRPELWNIYNGKIRSGEQMRIFPLSNWTELDVWNYIAREKIELPSVYFSHRRRCIRKKNGMILDDSSIVHRFPDEVIEEMTVRCRTVGDVTCTGLVESIAKDINDIIEEVIAARTTERGLRADDKVSESAMEDRKRKGYF